MLGILKMNTMITVHVDVVFEPGSDGGDIESTPPESGGR
jgi:hypothetical protein